MYLCFPSPCWSRCWSLIGRVVFWRTRGGMILLRFIRLFDDFGESVNSVIQRIWWCFYLRFSCVFICEVVKKVFLFLGGGVRDVTFYDIKHCYDHWCAEVKKYSMLFLVVRERLCIRWSFWWLVRYGSFVIVQWYESTYWLSKMWKPL